MRKFNFIWLVVFSVSIVISGCSNKKEASTKKINELIINAGAGLKPALDRVNAEFKNKFGTKIITQYMCSAMVLSNLLLARETDVFFPGSEHYMNIAIEKGAVNQGDAFPAAYMLPVITTPKGNPKNIKTLEDMTKPGIKVGLGEFETVAVGRLTKKMLIEADLFEAVSKNQVFVGPNSTKLQLNVALGSVDAAINWKATVLMFADKSECIDIPVKRLKYSIAPCGFSTFSKNRRLAQNYVDFIMSEKGQNIMAEEGYTLPNQTKNLNKVE
jgi:molybdate transport system substrate-binding protein